MDLTTHYMGLQLKNPLVASASPLSADLGNIRHLEDSWRRRNCVAINLRGADRSGDATPRDTDRSGP